MSPSTARWPQYSWVLRPSYHSGGLNAAAHCGRVRRDRPPGAPDFMNWRDYWNQDTPIYSGERHKLLHYRQVANDIIALVPSGDALVLDYGSGEALFADRIAARCGHLYLSDAAALVRDRLQER